MVNCIGFSLNNFDVLRYKVLILLITKLYTYNKNKYITDLTDIKYYKLNIIFFNFIYFINIYIFKSNYIIIIKYKSLLKYIKKYYNNNLLILFKYL